MKNNKLLMITLIILVTITLVAVIGYVLLTKLNAEPETSKDAPTIDEILVSSVDIEEITTNLADKRYVKIQLKIQTNGEEAGAELAKRDFQVKDLVIKELSEMTQEDLSGKEGKQSFQNTLKSKINELMDDGEVQQVYITSYIIQ
jgi:flagellar protein FliL